MHAPDTLPTAPEAPAARPALMLRAAAPCRTDALGRALAAALRPGDVVALQGALGAGKSHLARAVIRGWLGDPMAEVPSPTYTLVNVYAAPGTTPGAAPGARPAAGPGASSGAEIWHADLYRVDPEEIAEIGLADVLEHAILLVEWPDRWPGLPARRLEIALAAAGEGRDIAVTPHGAGWSAAVQALRDAS